MIAEDRRLLELFAARVRRLRQHGLTPGAGYQEIGFNYRLTDMQAALGCQQLLRMPELLAARRHQAALGRNAR